MTERGPNKGAGHRGTLRIRDRIPVEVRPLGPEWIGEVEAGRLGPVFSDRPEGDNRRYTSVDELLSSFPPDQRPEGPLAEALRLLDAKVNYLVQLLEETSLEKDKELPPAHPVELGVDGMQVDLEGEEAGLGPEDWAWVRAYLPGRPRIAFQTPARVRETSLPEGEGAGPPPHLDLKFANITENEERALSGYIFRRHREEVRRRREGEG